MSVDAGVMDSGQWGPIWGGVVGVNSRLRYRERMKSQIWENK